MKWAAVGVVTGVLIAGAGAWGLSNGSDLHRQAERLPALLSAHVQLSLLALFIAVAFSVPVGALISRVERVRTVVIGLAGVIQTIPSLALLAIMVPLLSGVGLPGIGFLPALVGLSLYCVLPILMATVTGISEVDPAMIEAADGVGMTSGQRLLRVELPLSLPVIVSGVRTATVWCVGMATLSTPVGAASLGDYIFGGLQTRNYVAVLVGCVAAGVLAQALDRTVAAFERGIRQRSRARVVAAATVLGLIALGSLVYPALRANGSGQTVVAIGSKPFTEQYILAEIAGQQLDGVADVVIEQRPSLGSTVAFDALCTGDLDLYVEYSGTFWATILHRTDIPERGAMLDEIARVLRDEYGVHLVARLGFENTYTLAMSRERASTLQIRSFTDLARVSSGWSIGGDYEFFQRQEWASVRDAYRMSFQSERSMDPALMYEAIRAESVDVIGAYSTDGRLDAYDLVPLVDDRKVIPPYDAFLLASDDFVRANPELVSVLERLEGALDATTMRRLNREVDRDGKSPSEVARAFLQGLSG